MLGEFVEREGVEVGGDGVFEESTLGGGVECEGDGEDGGGQGGGELNRSAGMAPEEN